MLHRVEGIVIRSVEYGEGNLIVTLMTGEFGKVGVMVRGAKKTRSRHAAVTQLYTYGEYVYYKSNTGTLGTLNHAELLDAFSGIRGDLRRSAYAAYFAEVTDRLVPDGEASAFLYEQLKAAYEALSGGKEPAVVGAMLELKLFAFSGVSPITQECAECGRSPEPQEAAFWSPAAGGLVCVSCAGAFADRTPLAPGVRKLLPVLQRADLRRLGDVNVKPRTRADLKQTMRRWFETHADVRLRTRAVLDQIEAVYADDDAGDDPADASGRDGS
ncbi:DNA repair protein RecO [Paenibacillus antri]|uniref:DNA repair protein RecO n=1 Tax=Paenibacillus antri TaxID=2582848 RepID=A0A5R9G3E0_9BACL|nr:DNA repair protein RecO [Paenibacillus antri]TLS50351.1 DNA repair protein RecO [Paenibacillus antri]